MDKEMGDPIQEKEWKGISGEHWRRSQVTASYQVRQKEISSYWSRWETSNKGFFKITLVEQLSILNALQKDVDYLY